MDLRLRINICAYRKYRDPICTAFRWAASAPGGGGADMSQDFPPEKAMQWFLALENITRFNDQIDSEADDFKRKTLVRLVAAEIARLKDRGLPATIDFSEVDADGAATLSSPLPLMPTAAPAVISEDVLSLIADSVICTDADGRILVVNHAAAQSFGYGASEMIGHPVEVLLPESERSDHVRQVRKFALGGGAANRLMGRRREVRGRRKNGDEFPAEAMVSRHTVDGRTVLTVVVRDITERKALEDLREAVSRELGHRMKNMLSVVNSLISLSAVNAVSVAEFKDSLMGRMRALAVSQNALQFGEKLSTSLSELLAAELAQFKASGEANLAIEVPPVPVGARAAQMLALAVHELATNSAKYGALGSVGGRVALTSAVQEEGGARVLLIKWQEDGGPPVSPPSRQGFGTTLITQVVARALRADVTLDYNPEGLVCRITVPEAMLEAGY